MILRLDLDAGHRLLTLGYLAWLCRRAGVTPAWLSQTRSPSGTGWHLEIAVDPPPRTAIEVTALQAILGSDRAREACNLTRARQVDAGDVSAWWAQRFNVLYR